MTDAKFTASLESPRAGAEAQDSARLGMALGDGITLTDARFGRSAGASVQVVTLQIDWVSGQVKVGPPR